MKQRDIIGWYNEQGYQILNADDGTDIFIIRGNHKYNEDETVKTTSELCLPLNEIEKLCKLKHAETVKKYNGSPYFGVDYGEWDWDEDEEE